MRAHVWVTTSLLLAIAGLTTSSAHATCFCMLRPPMPTSVHQQRGIADDPSYNPASAVVIVRDGTRTVLTIEAAYQGPPVELSMVIPVPTAIEREDVRTVTGTSFRRLDQRTAPRVRHVWPPCPRRPMRMAPAADSLGGGGGYGGGRAEAERVFDEFGVDIEDEWAVDEYDVTLLGAAESSGLFAFLRERGLALPDSAVPVLRAYIETGHRFVLARVDPSRANRPGANMMLSPIQLEYDSDELRIPVRLGTLNSPGEQELLLYVLSTDGRYEVANRPNVVAPTDIRMRQNARGTFAELYASITDEIFRRTPGAAITEYAHVIGRHVPYASMRPLGLPERDEGRRASRDTRTWTLTRIRHRYGMDLQDDLTLRRAEPLRLTRRWRYPSLRIAGRPEESAFHVQYVVEHRGCVDSWTQQRIARRFASAESLWEARRDLWPGEVILDPIESLGIEPRSSAPPGWPPPPPAPARPAPLATPEATPPVPVPVPVPTATPTTPPTPAPPAAPPEASSGCAVHPTRARRDGVWLAIALVMLLVARRARR